MSKNWVNALLFIIITLFIHCEKTPIEPTLPTYTPIFSYYNLENYPLDTGTYYTDQTGMEYKGWGIFEDIMFPGTSILWDMHHSNTIALSDTALACSITGGDRYNNVFFTNTNAIKWKELEWAFTQATYFIYELDFYIDGISDCQNPNNSELEGIEFTWRHVVAPLSFGFGLQWAKGGEWRYWDDVIDPQTNKPRAWQSFTPRIFSCLEGRKWYHIKFTGKQRGEGIQYLTMVIEGQRFNLESGEVGRAEIPESWAENFLQVGMQINGNLATDPSHGHGTDLITVYLDNITFKGFKEN